MKTKIMLLVCCLVVSAQTQKKLTIQKSGESDLLLVKTQKGFSTLIQFPESEEISEVTCGDKEYWVVEGKGRYLHVKPAKEGVVTNLNVLLKSDIIYSFLLKEISKPGGTKDKPDLNVVMGADEVSKLKKDKDNLEEALSRSDKALADLRDKAEAEKKQAQKKTEDEAVITVPKEEQPPKSEPALQPKVIPGPKVIAAVVPANTPEPKTPVAVAPVPAEPGVVIRDTVFARREGLLRKSGKALGRFFRKVGQVLRLY